MQIDRRAFLSATALAAGTIGLIPACAGKQKLIKRLQRAPAWMISSGQQRLRY